MEDRSIGQSASTKLAASHLYAKFECQVWLSVYGPPEYFTFELLYQQMEEMQTGKRKVQCILYSN